MSKKTILSILIVSWLITSIIACVLISKYIETKDERLRGEIRENIEKIFEGQEDGSVYITSSYGFFDSPFNGEAVKNIRRARIPAVPNCSDIALALGDNNEERRRTLERDARESWKSEYGDIASLWDLNWGSNEFNERTDEGWQIIGIYCCGLDEEFIHTFARFPYRVGLKHSEYGNPYSVADAVAEAYNFYTSDANSRISDRFEKGSYNRIWREINEYRNQYYGIHENTNYNGWYEGSAIPGAVSPREGGSIEDGWMQNGYYRVYMARTQETIYGIYKHSWNPDIKERNKLLIYWLSAISIVFLIPIVLLISKIRKFNKRKSETIKERLLRVCSPKAFMSPYNKDLVDKANNLYPKIEQAASEEELISLADEAQNLLGISMVEASEIESLKKEVNPSNFLKPYDAEKIALANKLYSTLQNEKLMYSEYKRVVAKAETLK